jgi:putative transposase
VTQRDEALLPRIQGLKTEHPFWGYRRSWAYLHFVARLAVNKKHVFRVMKEPNLLVKPNLRKAKRTPTRSKPRPTRPNEWWGIDMTKENFRAKRIMPTEPSRIIEYEANSMSFRHTRFTR